MGTMIILLILAVLAVFAVRSYSKTLSHGCCGAGDSTIKARVRDKNPSHYPYSATVRVEGMTCSHCRQRIENALNTEEGVGAEVDLHGGTALVRMKEPLSEERLRLVITREGYTVPEIQWNSTPPARSRTA